MWLLCGPYITSPSQMGKLGSDRGSHLPRDHTTGKKSRSQDPALSDIKAGAFSLASHWHNEGSHGADH